MMGYGPYCCFSATCELDVSQCSGCVREIMHLKQQTSNPLCFPRLNQVRWNERYHWGQPGETHYNDVIMGAIASKITSLAMVYPTGYPDADQRKHQSSASLAFVRGIQWPVTRKMFPFDDVIMYRCQDGDDAAVRSENFLPAHASLRPPTSPKFATKKHSMGGGHGTPHTKTKDSYLSPFSSNNLRNIRSHTTVCEIVRNNGRR